MTCRRSATPARWARRRGGGRLGAAERGGAGRGDAAGRAAGDWLRAMQDRLDVFGLRARRPFSAPGRLARRIGAKARPRRILWLTEEGASFARTAARFGIVPGRVTVLQRQEVAASGWPAIVKLVRRADGKGEGCGVEVAAGEIEVRHLIYERVGHELPDDPIGQRPGRHRREPGAGLA